MERDEPSDPPKPASLPAQMATRVEAIVRAAEEEAAAIQREIEAQRRVAETEGRRYLVEARRQADALADQRMRRLRELTDELIERAEATKHQFDALLAALQRASAAIESGADAPPATAAPQPPLARPAPPPPAARPAPPPPAARPAPPPSPEPPLPAPAPSARAEALARATEREADEPALGEPTSASPSFTPPPPPADYAGPAATGARPGAELDPATPGAESPDPRREDLGAARLVAIEMAVAGRTRAEVDRHLRDSFRIKDTADLLDDVFGGERGEDASRPSWGGA
jgi:hypothetical protein